MPTFREILEDDLNRAFFCADEFATEHEIDGKKQTAIVDDDRLTARKITTNSAGAFDGDILFSIPASQMQKPPIGAVMRFDGRAMRVTSSEEVDGMVSVTLKGARS